MVTYHIQTPEGLVTRTSRRQLEPAFSHIVVYDGNVGVPGDGSRSPVPTFHGRLDLAQKAVASGYKWCKTKNIYPITSDDCTIR